MDRGKAHRSRRRGSRSRRRRTSRGRGPHSLLLNQALELLRGQVPTAHGPDGGDRLSALGASRRTYVQVDGLSDQRGHRATPPPSLGLEALALLGTDEDLQALAEHTHIIHISTLAHAPDVPL